MHLQILQIIKEIIAVIEGLQEHSDFASCAYRTYDELPSDSAGIPRYNKQYSNNSDKSPLVHTANT